MTRFNLCIRPRTVAASTKTPNSHIQKSNLTEDKSAHFLAPLVLNVTVNYVVAGSPHLYNTVTIFNYVRQITVTQQTLCSDRIISKCGRISEPVIWRIKPDM